MGMRCGLKESWTPPPQALLDLWDVLVLSKAVGPDRARDLGEGEGLLGAATGPGDPALSIEDQRLIELDELA